VGQRVFVINQTAGANAGNLVRCTVTATAANQITVTNNSAIATIFDSGALVGYDPIPIMYTGLSLNRPSSYIGAIPAKGAIFIYGMNTTRMTGAAIAVANQKQYTVVNTQGRVFFGSFYYGSDYGEGWSNDAWQKQDPDVLGSYYVYPMLMLGGISNDLESTDHTIRASLDRIAFVTRGTALAQEDTIQSGTTIWLCFFGSATYTNYGHSTAFKTVE
jgi:hypothetical protein